MTHRLSTSVLLTMSELAWIVVIVLGFRMGEQNTDFDATMARRTAETETLRKDVEAGRARAEELAKANAALKDERDRAVRQIAELESRLRALGPEPKRAAELCKQLDVARKEVERERKEKEIEQAARRAASKRAEDAETNSRALESRAKEAQAAAERRKQAASDAEGRARRAEQAANDLRARAETAEARGRDLGERLRQAEEARRLLAAENEVLKAGLVPGDDPDAQEKGVHKELLGLSGKLSKPVFLIDISTSMRQSGRWESSIETVGAWLKFLPVKECALIAFSNVLKAYQEGGSPVVKVTPESRLRMLQHLKKIVPDGPTDLLAALQAAYRIPDIDSIVLFTDGKPGTDKVDRRMATAIEELSRNHSRIPVNIVAVGDYFNPAARGFLLGLAERTGGSFRGH